MHSMLLLEFNVKTKCAEHAVICVFAAAAAASASAKSKAARKNEKRKAKKADGPAGGDGAAAPSR